MPWGDNGDIYLPVDKYGRVLTKLDDGVRYAPAWVDGDNITNFDDASDSVLVNAMRDHGFIDALSYDDFSSITVNTLDGAPETISWSDDSNEFNVQIPLWANAAVTMSYKPLTLGDGSQIDCAVSDETGELIVWRDDNGDPRYCHVAHYDSGDALEWDNISDHPEIEEQTDGLRFIDIFNSVSDDFGETDTIVDAAGSSYFVMTTDQDGYYRDGSAKIPAAPVPITAELSGGGIIIPVSIEYVTGSSEEDGEPVTLDSVPVVVDSNGIKHVIVCDYTSTKYYGLELGKNVSGGMGAWYHGITVPDTGDKVLTGEYTKKSFVQWLFDHGINGQVFWDFS